MVRQQHQLNGHASEQTPGGSGRHRSTEDTGAWSAAVCRGEKSQTRLSERNDTDTAACP